MPDLIDMTNVTVDFGNMQPKPIVTVEPLAGTPHSADIIVRLAVHDVETGALIETSTRYRTGRLMKPGDARAAITEAVWASLRHEVTEHLRVNGERVDPHARYEDE